MPAAQVKSAFTRAFNTQHIKPKTGFRMEEGKKTGWGRGKGGGGAAEEEEEEAALREFFPLCVFVGGVYVGA